MARAGYDYVIIGSGSAGSVLAARLSEDPAVRILVLEAGPLDRSLYMLRMPAALAEPLKSERYNWAYWSEPEPFLDGRRVYYPRGRVVGGSSSINGMVYLRGNPQTTTAGRAPMASNTGRTRTACPTSNAWRRAPWARARCAEARAP